MRQPLSWLLRLSPRARPRPTRRARPRGIPPPPPMSAATGGSSQPTRRTAAATPTQLDKNSRYADPDEAKDNRFQRDGGGGIGVTVERTDDKKIMIRAVQDGSPAAKGGLQAGDQVIAIDGDVMVEATLGDIVH